MSLVLEQKVSNMTESYSNDIQKVNRVIKIGVASKYFYMKNCICYT